MKQESDKNVDAADESGARSHLDLIDSIGRTNASSTSRAEAQWNRYYFATYRHIVHRLLAGCARDSVLDVGTSDGSWFDFLRREGFNRIYGVEISPLRAEQARRRGYAEVFTCDAAATPLPESSIDAAVSNDVFVHILRVEEKVRVLQQIERLLKPSGRFIVNHPSSLATFNDRSYRVSGVCSFVSLDEFIALIHAHTNLKVLDIVPSYYHWRFTPAPLWLKAMRRLVALPAIPWLLEKIDRHYTRDRLPIEAADTFYLMVGK